MEKQNPEKLNFMKKLLGEMVSVNFIDGSSPVEGTFVGFNRYEILLESNSGLVSIFMKHAVLCIIPIDEKKNPLRVRKEEQKQ